MNNVSGRPVLEVRSTLGRSLSSTLDKVEWDVELLLVDGIFSCVYLGSGTTVQYVRKQWSIFDDEGYTIKSFGGLLDAISYGRSMYLTDA